MKRISSIYWVLILFIALYSCSVKKFIPEDEYLYSGANIEIEADTTIKDEPQLKAELQNVLRPQPNTKILGGYPGVYFYYKANREKPGFINKFLNKNFGEEPVYISQVDLTNTEDLLLNRLENRGFFYSQVASDTTINTKAKTGKASFSLQVPKPYLMETYQLDTDTMLVYTQIKRKMDNSLLEKGMRFDLPDLKAERERIDQDLKKSGYYNFNPGFLLFEADTNQYDKKRFDLYLKLKKNVPPKSVIPYEISNVNVYANYNIDEDSITKNFKRYKNKNYFQDEVFFKPKYLDPYILIQTGDFYDPEISRNTSRRLGSIGSYKFVNIEYEEIDTLATDSLGLLQANIYLSPLKKRAIRTELQAVTKSNSFTGPHLAITFANRNLFKGGESLNISANVGYEFQISSGQRLSSLQLGLKNDLIIPRLLFPVEINSNFFKYDIPRTKISLAGNLLNRSQLFTLGSVSSTFGWFWNANRYVSHELNPISLNYVSLTNTSPEFEDILRENPFLQNSFDQEFISGLTYSFIYNGLIDANKQHAFFFNANLDIAGNTVSLLGKEAETGKKEVFGLEYAQYAKIDGDFHYHFRLPNNHVIATRLFAGIGMPYGNSDVLPFSKQYFSGGPYSVRAFRIRSLGPGSYYRQPQNQVDEQGNPVLDQNGDPIPVDNIGYFDQTGNIRLEANAEYRFPLITYLNGAFFIDAGNVWNSPKVAEASMVEGDTEPRGAFTSNFLNEFGIGGGAGLRVDIQSFVIRLDLAFPFHDPNLPGGPEWVFDFGRPVLNFGIGYPF